MQGEQHPVFLERYGISDDLIPFSKFTNIYG